MFIRNRKKLSVAVACILLLGMLSGCGERDKVNSGMDLIKELDYAGALQEFSLAREAGENERLITRGEGIAYLGLAEYEQAIGAFQASLSGSDGWVQDIDYDVNYYLAAAYTKNKEYEHALDIYNAILALRPKEKDAYLLRGNVLLALSRYDEAKADFDKLIAMDPKNYDRLISIYEILEKYGYRDVGLEYLQRVIDASDSNKMDDYDKGRIYYYMGDYQKAYIALESVKEKAGAQSCLYLGKSYEAMGEYIYASNVYNSYISKDSGNAAVYNQLGICEMAKKDYSAALKAFQTGKQIENNGMMQTLSYNEIVAYEYLGDFKKAEVLMESYLKAYPDDEQAKREQIFLSTR